MYFERDEGEEVVMLTRNVLAKKVIIEVTSGSSANRKHDKDDGKSENEAESWSHKTTMKT